MVKNKNLKFLFLPSQEQVTISFSHEEFHRLGEEASKVGMSKLCIASAAQTPTAAPVLSSARHQPCRLLFGGTEAPGQWCREKKGSGQASKEKKLLNITTLLVPAGTVQVNIINFAAF